MRAAEHASRGPSRLFECRYGLAEIIERGGGVFVENLPVNPPDLERVFMTRPENTPRHGYHFYGATLDDLREAVTTLEDTSRIARRVFGSAHPLTTEMEGELREARAALRARETPPSSSPSGDV